MGRTTFAILVASYLAAALPSQAEIVFYDDFSDGDAEDGSPVSWAPSEFRGGATFDVVNGDLIVSLSDGFGIMIPQIPLLDAVSFRWQARVVNHRSFVGYWVSIAYGDDETVTRYAGRLHHTDDETEGGLNKRIDQGTPDPNITAPIDLAPHLEDVVLQLDVIDSTVSFWAWKAGEPMPNEPFAQFEDSEIAEGKIGVEFATGNFAMPPTPTAYQMAVRYVVVSDTPLRGEIPEPSSLLLASLAGALFCSCKRRL